MSSYVQLGNRNRELYALTEVAKAITVNIDLTELMETVMDRIDDVLDPAEFGVLMLWDPVEAVFRPRASCGPGLRDLGALYAMRLGRFESLTGKVFGELQPHLWSTAAEIVAAQETMSESNRKLLRQALNAVAPKSVVAAPLVAGEHRYGVLLLGTLSGTVVFRKTDVSFVQTLADLIALAIDRSRLEDEATWIKASKRVELLRAEALATLSHELRTPLAAIKGYSTALLLSEVEWPPEKQRDFLQMIDAECDNLQTMIGDILDSSLIDVGQLSLAREPVRLSYLAQEVAEDMQRRTMTHRLVVDFPPDFPIVQADILRMKQVIRNILDNSIKYSPDGGMIMIRGTLRVNDVVVSISDQGIGISPEDLIPLFEKYFRVKDPTGHHVPGTGLGLPVARAIVEAHGGHIWAESKVGEGTVLYFSFPKGESEPVSL